MIKILLKKQMAEMFRMYFYDAKKNKARSKGAVIGLFVLYAFLIVGVLGGIFTYFAISLCRPLSDAGVPWLYFLLIAMISIALGVFGSVFNTFASLYLARDNDLLLSMPIPVRAIMVSRLLGVYLMGLMYSGIVIIPAVIVYFVTVPVTPLAVVGSILLVVCVTLFVLVLSCLLGWVVAKISVKLRHKSVITVLASLVFIGLYYLVYFRAQSMITELVANAAVVGAKIRGAAYPLYAIGKMGTGDPLAIVSVTAVTVLLVVLTAYLIAHSFIRLATTPQNIGKKAYVAGREKVHSPDMALLRREAFRFTSSANYMLNCGMAILLIPICAVLLLWKGGMLAEMIPELLGTAEAAVVFAVGGAFALAAMNDISAPSVSLEGKNLWIARSLPVTAWQILRAKLWLHVALTAVPMTLYCICAAIGLRLTILQTVLLLAAATAYVFFSAALGLALNLKHPNLTWSNENIPIKQSLPVFLCLFGGWIYGAAAVIVYFLFPGPVNAVLYLLPVTAVTIAAAAALWIWLYKRGARIYEAL